METPAQTSETPHPMFERYERVRQLCLRIADLHPESRAACYQALAMGTFSHVEIELASTLDDMMLALTASQSSLAAERREREEIISALRNTCAANPAGTKCEACRRTGVLHCAHPDECGGMKPCCPKLESAEARIAELENRINGGWVDAALPAKD